ncbi:hypothetical protein V6N13_134801 [Hibiscus sabdariffa]|uniref:Uncharacterized protein n=1 Tax=Hibiscus sabdariffa TaxID=183260 RepID=A0ABR2R4V3_9ROSI
MEGAKANYEKEIRPRSEPRNSSSDVEWISVSGTDSRQAVKQDVLDDKQKLREAEKAENLMHLICFGPCVN